jgi:hypothetical protein
MTAKARQLYRDEMGYAAVVWVFFALYLGMVINSNVMLSRARPSRYLPALVLFGGIMNAGMSMMGSPRSIIMFRFPITMIEAVYFPGVLYVLSCWYKPQELGKCTPIRHQPTHHCRKTDCLVPNHCSHGTNGWLSHQSTGL